MKKSICGVTVLLALAAPVVSFAGRGSQAGLILAGENKVCGTRDDIRCAEGLWCDRQGGACDDTTASGLCVPIPRHCPAQKEDQKVCGCDGRQYASDCLRQSAQVQANAADKCEKKCEREWKKYVALGRMGRFLVGGMKAKAAGTYGNAAGDKIEDGLPADLRSDELGGSFDVGYFDKSVLRDALFAAYGHDQFVKYCEGDQNDPERILFLDAVKFSLQGGYGTTITDKTTGTSQEFTTEEKWRYNVGLSYEVPFEGLVEGMRGIKSKD